VQAVVDRIVTEVVRPKQSEIGHSCDNVRGKFLLCQHVELSNCANMSNCVNM
jgi:hypothetical protein